MIENWLAGLALAKQTKNQLLYTLRTVLRGAEAEKLIAVDPLVKAEALGRNHRSRDVLTMDELRKLFPGNETKLLEVWKKREYVALFVTMASTGIRCGEAQALAGQHLLPKGWLLVERATKMGGKMGETKTGERRAIGIPVRTRTALAWWRTESPFKKPEDLILYGTAADEPLNVRTVADLFPGVLQRVERQKSGK